MKILQLCKKFPYPLKDGESIAVTYLSRALTELGCQVTLLTMNTTKHYTDISTIPASFNHYQEIHSINIDNSLKIVEAVKNIFSSDSYHVSRYVNDEFSEKLVSLLQAEEYDVVQLETLYLSPYVDLIKKNSKALVTMRAHNVEFEIWERLTQNTTFLPKKIYLNYLTKKLKRFEIDNLNNYDYLIPVSNKDLSKFKTLGYMNGAMSSPIGLETKRYLKSPSTPKVKDEKTFNLCFIGALDWMPNAEGLNWFLENVWDTLLKESDQYHLYVAGRNTPDSLMNLSKKNVHILGEVDDAIDFISDCDAMIVPLFSGSGTRVKILEGMALGKIVLTTTLGLEGIEAKHNKEIIVADTPSEFEESIHTCRENKNLSQSIGRNARQFVVDYYDNKKNAEILLQTYEKLVKSPAYKK